MLKTQSAGLLLENAEDTTESIKALRNAFVGPQITELRIFKFGDCAAVSGVLIAARLLNTGSLFLALLLDLDLGCSYARMRSIDRHTP